MGGQVKEKSPRILPWALCHLEGRELRTRREAETARARAGPELCDSGLQGSPARRASLGHFSTLPRRLWASLICPHLFEPPEGRDWPQSTSQVTPHRVQVPGVRGDHRPRSPPPLQPSLKYRFQRGSTLSPWATSSTCKLLTASLGLKAPSLARDRAFP